MILKRHGIPRIAEERPDFPFVAVSPQCPEGSTWNHHLRSLDLLLEDIQKNYVVDPARLYLTGISMGGNGVWLMAVRHPERFAAVAPICGYGLPSQGFPDRVCALKDIPVWVFHGAEDDIVPVAESRILADTLNGCGGRVRLTIYPETGHDSWTRTYNDPAIYEWFLCHSLAV